MKYLLNNNFKIMRKGSHVVANENVGEFIYDDEISDLTHGQLKDIAEANKLQCVGKSKTQYQQSLNEALKMVDVAEQNGPTETQKVEEIVRNGFEQGHDDDTIMIAIVQAGISFRRALRMFKDAVETLGLRTSVKDVKEVASKLLAELDFNPQSYNDVKQVAEQLVEKVEGATHVQAMTAIKAYAKENEIALPKREKGEKEPKGANGRPAGKFNKFYQFLLDNPQASQEDIHAFAADSGVDEKRANVLKAKYFGILKLCQAFAEKHGKVAEGQAE